MIGLKVKYLNEKKCLQVLQLTKYKELEKELKKNDRYIYIYIYIVIYIYILLYCYNKK